MVNMDLVPFIGIVCSYHDMVLLIKLKLIPIVRSSVLPRMMSYLHCSEVKTSACKFPIDLLANSGNLIFDMMTFSLVLNVPFVVVVLLGGPCLGTTPYGKLVVLIIVVVLPESHKATSVLSRGTFWIVVALIYTIGVRSCLWLKDLVLFWYVSASG